MADEKETIDNIATGIVGGATTGGMIAGPPGALIGAGVGTVIGFIKSLF
uniref:Uncharacterized protein n=1 Tax=Meloidogyne enterolobii TaxID=390850 RepID=A0A6V7WTW2_MELEN|nr:unnamed protein product [Meloidogyne enterolobii]